MNEDQIPLNEFTSQIERIFGKELTPPALQAATDFWTYWDQFVDIISQRQLSVRVDPFFLANTFPQYRRHHAWKGGALLLLALGVVLVWFFWPIGVALMAGAVASHKYGNHIRFNEAKIFAEDLMKEATLSPANAGFARLCACYVAGIVELATPALSSHWPQYPSNVLTGDSSLIEK